MSCIRFFVTAMLCASFSHLAQAADAAELDDDTKAAIQAIADGLEKKTATSMTLKEEGSYLLGLQLAMQAQQSLQQAQGDLGELDDAQVFEGITDVFKGNKFKVNPQLRWKTVIDELRKQASQANGAVFETHKKAGEEYLAGLKGKDGFVFTDSGIAYEVVRAAEGKKPIATSEVKVHYHGTHIDGSVFDSSYDRKQPATFALNRVIPGWTEGLQLMSEGSKYRFYIPYNLAYGERGSGSNIKPGEMLIFDVELLQIIK